MFVERSIAIVAGDAMMHRLGVQTASVLGLVSILRIGSIDVGQERFFNFPIVRFSSDAKFEIFFCN